MKDDEVRALAIVALLLSGASSTAGFVGGRMTVEPPPPEVRLVRLPPRVLRVPMAEAAPVEAPAEAPAAAPDPPFEPPPTVSEPPASIEVKPLPPPAPKVQAKPKPLAARPPAKPARPEREAAARKARPPALAKRPLPSCAVVRHEYDAMSWSQRMAAYHRATPEEIAHGKRCLGF